MLTKCYAMLTALHRHVQRPDMFCWSALLLLLIGGLVTGDGAAQPRHLLTEKDAKAGLARQQSE